VRKRHWSYQGEKNRLAVLKRDGRRCQIQGVGCLVVANAVDHIVPHSLGGSDAIENLRAACKHCNSAKGRRMTEEQASKPVFKSHSFRRAPLPKISPNARWTPLKPENYR
jgi:5-methylcytosine-specific restriction endonuclease McrA